MHTNGITVPFSPHYTYTFPVPVLQNDLFLVSIQKTAVHSETKGGEASGHSKNIDMQMGNKFLAFKRYAEEYGLKWGFAFHVRIT